MKRTYYKTREEFFEALKKLDKSPKVVSTYSNPTTKEYWIEESENEG